MYAECRVRDIYDMDLDYVLEHFELVCRSCKKNKIDEEEHDV